MEKEPKFTLILQMKTLDNNLPIYFLGDHHGAWTQLTEIIDFNKLTDCYIISVGDLGMGFALKQKEYERHEKLNKFFAERNIHFYGIRGNHDNPDFFKGDPKFNLTNFKLIEDYSLFKYQDKTIQAIGGAISIDRTGRQLNVSYWDGEGVVFEKNKCEKVDILITHTAPSCCFPQQFNEIVYGWAREDDYLIEDLNEERSLMDKIFKVCRPSFHVYGHFHSSWTEEISGCKHKLLDIDEFFEYRSQ